MSDRLQHWILNHPFSSIAVSILLIAVASSGLSQYQVNNNPRQFFSEENKKFISFTNMEKRFTSNEMVLLMIAPKNGDMFTRTNLMLLEELTERSWMLPKTIRVDSMASFQHTHVEDDELIVDYLVENAQNLSSEKINEIKNIALNEPALINSLISKNGHVAGISSTVMLDEGAVDAPLIAKAARVLRDEYRERYPEIDFYLSGSVIFSDATEQATHDAIAVTGSFAFIAVTFCLFLIFRSFTATAITLLVVVLSISGAMGIAAWLGVIFSPTSSMAPAMILTLAVADCVHILVSYQQQIELGFKKKKAIAESIRVNMQPIFLTSITTATGFLFLNSSESPPFRDMGNIVFFGVLLVWLLSIVLLPALVMLLPETKRKTNRKLKESKAMIWLADLIIAKRSPALWIMSTIVVLFISFIPRNEFNDVWSEYFDSSYEVRQANDFMMRELTGMYRLEFSIPADGPQGTMEPAYQKNLDIFKQWAESQSYVTYASTFSDAIKRLNLNMHGGDSAYYSIPDQRELLSQYVLMYELSLPFGLGIDNQMDIDKSEARFSVVMNNTTINDVIEFEDKAYQWMKKNFPTYMQTRGTGLDMLFGGIAQQNMKSMISGTIYALLSVSLLLIFALRSVKYGLLSILPNLLPAAMSFGLWGLMVGQIGLSVSVVACMTLGIVVDDTVHFLSKYVRAKREFGLSSTEAARYSMKTVGVALVATSVVLVANFSVMAMSHFHPSASMGLLAAITIVMALIVNFFFFVPVLILIDHSEKATNSVTRATQPVIDADDKISVIA